MTKRRPVIAATFSLTMLAIGLAATASGAQRFSPSKTSNTVTAPPATRDVCYGGGGPNCTPRTKNAALPATTIAPTTTRPRTVTTPVPSVNTIMRTKNAALTTTTIKPRTKNRAVQSKPPLPPGSGH